jgi:crotonobetainyl-CoA:carnitine CoA-transferase CaiB-like acyl-CoA transferase
MRSPIGWTATSFKIRPAPGYGEHLREVLREAGYADAEIDSLCAAGVVKEM